LSGKKYISGNRKGVAAKTLTERSKQSERNLREGKIGNQDVKKNKSPGKTKSCKKQANSARS